MLCVCFLQDDDDGRKVITLTDLARIEIFVEKKKRFCMNIPCIVK